MYTGNLCDSCASGFFMYKPNYCGTIIPNCIDYVQNTLSCQTCSENLSPPDCITCNIGFFMNNDSDCQACSNSGCEGCNNTNCYSCLTQTQLNCTSDNKPSKLSISVIIGITIGGFGGLVLISGVIIFVVWYRNRLRNSRVIAAGSRGMFEASSLNQINRRPQLSNQSSAISLPMSDPMKEQTVYDEMCSICLQRKPNIVTYCHHVFHLDCLRLWYEKDRRCPNCNGSNNQIYAKCRECNRYNINIKMRVNRHTQTICKQCKNKLKDVDGMPTVVTV